MKVNLGLIVNIVLLCGFLVKIFMMIRKRGYAAWPRKQEKLNNLDAKNDAMVFDEVISVRKISDDILEDVSFKKMDTENRPSIRVARKIDLAEKTLDNMQSCMVFIAAKDDRQFNGYELLQTLFSAGLRYGDGNLFHRHQYQNGHGPVICSLALASSDGTFDLQKLGALLTRGLCLFMYVSGNPALDDERLQILLDTANELCEELDAKLLDDKQQIFNEVSKLRYQQLLGVKTRVEEFDAV
jgi:cell division protein ZipA